MRTRMEVLEFACNSLLRGYISSHFIGEIVYMRRLIPHNFTRMAKIAIVERMRRRAV
jgi:hypothetical protein